MDSQRDLRVDSRFTVVDRSRPTHRPYAPSPLLLCIGSEADTLTTLASFTLQPAHCTLHTLHPPTSLRPHHTTPHASSFLGGLGSTSIVRTPHQSFVWPF